MDTLKNTSTSNVSWAAKRLIVDATSVVLISTAYVGSIGLFKRTWRWAKK